MNDKNYIKTLPPYLQDDINNLLEELKNNDSKIIDCLLDEVYGSINSALYSNEITDEEANILREKYYWNVLGSENNGKD